FSSVIKNKWLNKKRTRTKNCNDFFLILIFLRFIVLNYLNVCFLLYPKAADKYLKLLNFI
ncbi:hypothetical protein ODY89_20360, partial [Shewanella xiamenensis]|uniref:hypothetical protein n=1 Tax=Shewanella xiamenensis TaxID=332186 RepID=UPI0024A62AA1